jgi:hypothetical protein
MIHGLPQIQQGKGVCETYILGKRQMDNFGKEKDA